MKNQMVKIGILIGMGMMTQMSCGSSQTSTQAPSTEKRGQGPQGGSQGERGQGRPTTAQLMSEMDADKDGLLSQSEVKGPLSENFSTIDSNEDGYLSASEIENAPRPEHGGGRPQR